MRPSLFRTALTSSHSHSGFRAPLSTERKLTAAELEEMKRKRALVIQKERVKEEQTRKYGAPIGQAFFLGIGGLVACSIVGYGWYRYMTENIKGNARSGYKAQQDAKSKPSAKQKEAK